MRRSIILAAVFIAAGLAATLGGAQATEPVTVEGTLVGYPIPTYWRIFGADMVGRDGKLYLRVMAEGNCRTEWREECHSAGDGRVICRQIPERVCDETYALHLLPEGFRIDDKRVLFASGGAEYRIGKVKSFLFWKWISLRDGVNIQATYDRAALVLDLDALGNSTDESVRVDNFARIYNEGASINLMVAFRGVNNDRARQILTSAGYAGDFAPVNDWRETDVTRNEIGIQVAPAEGAKLISLLQENPLVTSVKPVTPSL